MKPNITTEQCIEWLNDELSCEDGTSEKYFYFLTTIRDKLLAAQKMAEALERIATTHYRIYDGNKPYISDHDNSYSLGIADGHRLAAKWAEEALATKPTEGR